MCQVYFILVYFIRILLLEMVQRTSRFIERYDGLFNVPGIALSIALTVDDLAIHLVYRALLLSCRTSYEK